MLTYSLQGMQKNSVLVVDGSSQSVISNLGKYDAQISVTRFLNADVGFGSCQSGSYEGGGRGMYV